MGKRLRLEDTGNQAAARTPVPGTEVKIAIDLSRTKRVYWSLIRTTVRACCGPTTRRAKRLEFLHPFARPVLDDVG